MKNQVLFLINVQKNVQYFDCLNLSIIPSNRLMLHKNIEQRLDNMINSGFIDEVSTLLEKYESKKDASNDFYWLQAGKKLLRR